jgi:CrcB protein
MEVWKSAVLVGVGGFFGSMLRFLVGQFVQPNSNGGFPYATFLINVVGSFAIGIVISLAAKDVISSNWRLVLAVGVLGGFTTYSAFAFETVKLLNEKAHFMAAAYFFGTGFVAVMACFSGIAVTQLLTRG